MVKPDFAVARRVSGAWFLSLTALLAVPHAASAQQTTLGTNLIVNPGAEAGPASSGLSTVVSSVPGWTVAGNGNVLSYDITGLLLSTDPAPPDRGFQYFVSASSTLGATSTLTQDIDVSSASSVISGGNVKFTLSAYLGSVKGTGLAAPAQLAVAFKNGNGQIFSTATLGPLGLSGDGMSMQQQIGLVPAGTVRITATLTLSTHCLNAAQCSNGAADSLSLVLAALGTSPGAVLGTNQIVNGGAEAGAAGTASTRRQGGLHRLR